MVELPFRVCYTPTRRQRLAALLDGWPPCLAACLGFTLGVTFLSLVVSRWFAPLLVLPVVVTRRFFAGLVGVLRRPPGVVEVVVGAAELAVSAGGEPVRLPLDGVIQVARSGEGAWAVYHLSGTVLTIPAGAITAEQLDYLKAAALRSAARRRHDPPPE